MEHCTQASLLPKFIQILDWRGAMVDFIQIVSVYLETIFHLAFLRAFETSPMAPCLHSNVDIEVESYALTVHLESNETAKAALAVMEAEYKSGFKGRLERLRARNGYASLVHRTWTILANSVRPRYCRPNLGNELEI
jgi:hypothetical protein